MIFGVIILLTALTLSIVAAFYSITGLVAIFSAMPIPIIVMGGTLEIAKIVSTVFLHNNWKRLSILYKVYLVPAVIVLMFLTSIGIFGLLSKAHSDQSLVSGDVTAQVAIYDEKIKVERENIDTNRKALKQLDESVDQIMGRSTDEKGADKAIQVRRSQQKERTRLLSEIQIQQIHISKLNEERAPVAAQVRKVEAEVGPIKYVAALLYGDNPDQNVLERAVRWVIILIVSVFDPLALILILAAQQSLRWAKDESEIKEEEPELDELSNLSEKELLDKVHEVTQAMDAGRYKAPEEPKYEKDNGPLTDDEVKNLQDMVEIDALERLQKTIDEFHKDRVTNTTVTTVEPATPVIYASHSGPITDLPITPDTVIQEPVINSSHIPETAPRRKVEVIDSPATAERYKAPVIDVPHAMTQPKTTLVADNVDAKQVNSNFGTVFPTTQVKGDIFVRVDYLPNRVFKYNGDAWIEVDKLKTDSYTYDEKYIQFLIDRLKTGEYELDQLSASEQELVEAKLNERNDDKT